MMVANNGTLTEEDRIAERDIEEEIKWG